MDDLKEAWRMVKKYPFYLPVHYFFFFLGIMGKKISADPDRGWWGIVFLLIATCGICALILYIAADMKEHENDLPRR